MREITEGKHGEHAAQVILTTHSPYLLDHVDLDRDQVLVFQRQDDGSRTAQPVDASRLKNYLDEFMLGEVWFNESEEGLVSKSSNDLINQSESVKAIKVLEVLQQIASELLPARCRHDAETGFKAFVEDVRHEFRQQVQNQTNGSETG